MWQERTLVINYDEINLFKEFRDICTLDYNKAPGDSQGRNRSYAVKIFTYMYLYMDWRSPYISNPDVKRNDLAKRSAGLPKDWKPDSLVKKAMEKYDAIQRSEAPTTGYLISAKRAIELGSQTIQIQTDELQEVLSSLEEARKKLRNVESGIKVLSNNKSSISAKESEVEIIKRTVNVVGDTLQTLFSLNDKVDKQFESLKELESRIKKESDNSREKIKGGHSKGNRADVRR